MTEEFSLLTHEKSRDGALHDVLLEVDALTDRERRKLGRSAPHLTKSLKDLKAAQLDYQNAVYAESLHRLRSERRETETTITALLLHDDVDDEPHWEVYPEVDQLGVKDDFVQLFKSHPQGDNYLLVRAIPVYRVADIRSIPRDHPIVLAAREWTLENQGQPSWEDELVSDETQAKIAELADGNPSVIEAINRYLRSEGEFPHQDWIDAAHTTEAGERAHGGI